MIDDKLKRLEDNLRSLSLIKSEYSLEDIQSDKIDEWGLRYGLFETIQIIIDLACSIVTKKILEYQKIIQNVSSCLSITNISIKN